MLVDIVAGPTGHGVARGKWERGGRTVHRLAHVGVHADVLGVRVAASAQARSFEPQCRSVGCGPLCGAFGVTRCTRAVIVRVVGVLAAIFRAGVALVAKVARGAVRAAAVPRASGIDGFSGVPSVLVGRVGGLLVASGASEAPLL